VDRSTAMSEETVWARLRRRKVVQWGIAYAAGAWGLLQGLNYVTEIFHWPEYLQPVTAIVLFIGLPIVLVVAWYHGDQGRQRVTGPELAIISLLFLVGGGLFWRYDHGSESPVRQGEVAAPGGPAAAATGAGAPGTRAPPNSIAVLPFVNMSGDASNQYFSDGISEEILNVLAQSPQLQVAARTSSFSFKGKSEEVPEIARALNVRMVLEGSVRKQDDKVRITAQLIDAQTGFHVWSETYDRELKDVFAIQDEIARSIGDEMKVKIVGTGSNAGGSGRTTNPEAHDHYLRGLALWQTRVESNLWQALDEFNKAIAIDSGYAEAYGGLALTYSVIADYSGTVTYEDATARATRAAEMALALDPLLPEAYAALGNSNTTQTDRALGRALLRRAIELRPSFATAYQWLGTTLMSGGDPEAGLEYSERSSMLDPRSPIVADNHMYVLSAVGRYEDAKAVCQRALAFAPDFKPCLVDVGIADVMLGKPEDARRPLVRAAEVDNPSAVTLVNDLIDALSGRGDKRGLALRLAGFSTRSAEEQGSGNIFDPFDLLPLIVALGEPQVALDYIGRHVDERYGFLDWAMARASLDPIRCDPRFQAAEKKLAMNDVRAAKLCGAPRPAD
jgi:TolB-like protein/tetratricopeptide (TPR) repeat protein